MTAPHELVCKSAEALDINHSICKDLLKEVFNNAAMRSGMDADAVKEALRTIFVYPAIEHMIGDANFPEVTKESATKKNGDWKVTILNKAAKRQHPYFPYESTAVKAVEHGVHLVDSMTGEPRPYNAVRDDINQAIRAATGPTSVWDHLAKKLAEARDAMNEASNVDAAAARHMFITVLDSEIRDAANALTIADKLIEDLCTSESEEI